MVHSKVASAAAVSFALYLSTTIEPKNVSTMLMMTKSHKVQLSRQKLKALFQSKTAMDLNCAMPNQEE